MIGRGGVVVWAGGGLGQADPSQPVDTSISSGAIPADASLAPAPTTITAGGVSIPNPFASWGAGEWVVAILGAFALYSMMHTAGEGVGAVSSWRSKRSSRARRRRELESEYAGL